jgi:hypothetical protein
MILDATTFECVLTPEAALGVVQKEVTHRGYKKLEVEEIRLIYSPYYLFSFDVKNENGPPVTGKAALNAYTGEISDFIPMIMDRPLKKTKNAQEGSEVEESAISLNEAKTAAKEKIAAQTGLKTEMVSVSAFSKVYIPFYRVWLEVAHSPLKVDVDALMGVPLGIENTPERQKTWGEATGETLNKLKSPSGWAEMTGKAIGAFSGGGDSHGGADHGGGGHDAHGSGADSGKTRRWIILLVVIGALAYFLFLQPNYGVKCDGTISTFKNGCILRGICEISGKKQEDWQGKVVQIYLKDGKLELYEYQENVGFFEQMTGAYNITWQPSGKDCKDYGWAYRRV